MTDRSVPGPLSPAGNPLTRRAFLVGTGGVVTAASFTNPIGSLLSILGLPNPIALLFPPPLTNSFSIRRPDDQCVLVLDFYNIAPDFSGRSPVLRQPNSLQASYLAVTLKPQHVTEESFILTDPPPHALKPQPNSTAPTHLSLPPLPPPVDSAVAGTSRLVFVIPANQMLPHTSTPLPFDTATLLNWSSLAMNLAPNAVPQGALPSSLARPSAPDPTYHTALEVPYRVQISPVGSVAWVNAGAPVTGADGWTELWHTRLAAAIPVSNPITDSATRPGSITLDALVNPTIHYFEDDAHRVDRTVRAIWCLDQGFANTFGTSQSLPATDTPFNTSLQPRDRADIVRLSSDFALVAHNRKSTSGAAFIPSAATADRLIMTSYGATMDVEDHWDLQFASGDYNSSLLQWRHRTWGGRDTYVRVVRKGYVFPFGHRASLVTINERKLSSLTGSGSPGAFLRERIFIVIAQPIKDYDADYITHQGRKLPFTAVEAVTLTTPDLDAETSFVTGLDAPYCFQPRIGGQPYRFHFRGTDYDGQPTDFRCPILWVDDTIAYGGSGASAPIPTKTNDQIMTSILHAWQANYPTVDTRRARISVAPSASAGDTNVSVESFLLGVENADGPSANALAAVSQPDFVPTVHQFTLHMPEVATMSGNGVGGPQLEYNPTYLGRGFDSTNPGELFLSRPSSVSSSPKVTFNAGKSGGAITPNFSIDAYTRTLGPTGAAQGGDLSTGLSNLVQGMFDPSSIFDAADAHLLGGVPLTAILGQMKFGADATTPGQSLQLTNRQTGPHQITTILDWQPPITPGGPTLAGQQINIFYPIDPSTGTKDDDGDTDGIAGLFNLHAVVLTDLSDASRSTYSIVGQLESFELDLFGDGDTYFIQIPFNSLTFHAQKDKKTEVQVDVGTVTFQGALNFVQELASYLNFTGSGLTISTEGSGVTVDLQVAIPSIGIGVLSIENIAFDAGCIIPYNGDPVAFNFSFCTRENPFNLSVMGFEGGGFVGLAVTAKGLEMLEFSFDFGIGYSIDIGIASGNIYLDGGIYFEIDSASDGTQSLTFTAFIKAGGGVSALGIISVSVELYLALTYQSGGGGPDKLIGEADLTVSVHILFFGGSFTIGMSEEFDAGSTSTTALTGGAEDYVLAADVLVDDPSDGQTIKTFGDLITSADMWSQYTTAFVPAGG